MHFQPLEMEFRKWERTVWGSVVFGWRALRPPRVVFVIGFVYFKEFSHFRQKRGKHLLVNYKRTKCLTK